MICNTTFFVHMHVNIHIYIHIYMFINNIYVIRTYIHITGPVSYVPKLDAFVTVNHSTQAECYRYQVNLTWKHKLCEVYVYVCMYVCS